MIISLGSLLLKTEPRRNDTRDVAAMHVAGATSEDILKVSYRFVICILAFILLEKTFSFICIFVGDDGPSLRQVQFKY